MIILIRTRQFLRMNNMEKEQNSLKDSFGIISKELAESRAHLEREEERVEYEKNDFANKLKNGFGDEIKAVLAEKEAIEKNHPKENKFKNFLKKIIQTCR